MQIIDLVASNKDFVEQAARVLVESFREHCPAWPDLKSALAEVNESLVRNPILRIAVKSNLVIGIIGGIPKYDGRVWELHPLAVHPDFQKQDVGSALVRDFEERVAEQGGLTIWLGTDDEDYRTSLAGVDLYPNVLENLAKIKNIKGHPYSFYEKLGYAIVGVMPDANGFGKPDIYMAKRVGTRRD